MAKSWVSDIEREVLSAVAGLATSNPFLPDRIADERRALGEAFVRYSPVWHMDGKLAGINPNLEPLRRVTEELAESLRSRLVSGAQATEPELLLYEGFIRHLLFYRYHADLTSLITDRELGKQATQRVAGYGRFRNDYDHFLRLDGVQLPIEADAAHVFSWGYQIRRAFHHTYWQIYGSSSCMAELRAAVWRSIFTHNIERYRRTLFNKMADIPTLILGESGTGKELVSRAIGMSRYIPFDEKKEAFVVDFAEGHQAVNLQALSASLVESELFGHKRGSFTGADADRAGWFESCGTFGTIFLDEVGELDPAIQVKLLRVLQDRVFQRIGEVEDRRFEGKIVAATNRDLRDELEAGNFRSDLYYRLCADVIRMPTLRDQLHGNPDELRALVHNIAKRWVEEEADELTDEVVRWIGGNLPESYPWPGNVRELEQCVRSVLVQGSYKPSGARSHKASDTIATRILAGESSAEELLREYATRVYARVGSYEAAARVLGLDRRTVKAKIDGDLLERLQS